MTRPVTRHTTAPGVRPPVLEIFVSGALTNPLNGSFSRSHWTHKAEWARTWRMATWAVLRDEVDRAWFRDPEAPKHVHFLAQTGARWDDDSIPAGCKPIRDALMGMKLGQLVSYRVIHSDAPDSGHIFSYAQVVNRKERGVKIRIEALNG